MECHVAQAKGRRSSFCLFGNRGVPKMATAFAFGFLPFNTKQQTVSPRKTHPNNQTLIANFDIAPSNFRKLGCVGNTSSCLGRFMLTREIRGSRPAAWDQGGLDSYLAYTLTVIKPLVLPTCPPGRCCAARLTTSKAIPLDVQKLGCPDISHRALRCSECGRRTAKCRICQGACAYFWL